VCGTGILLLASRAALVQGGAVGNVESDGCGPSVFAEPALHEAQAPAHEVPGGHVLEDAGSCHHAAWGVPKCAGLAADFLLHAPPTHAFTHLRARYEFSQRRSRSVLEPVTHPVLSISIASRRPPCTSGLAATSEPEVASRVLVLTELHLPC
jgi:hypothetical protein